MMIETQNDGSKASVPQLFSNLLESQVFGVAIVDEDRNIIHKNSCLQNIFSIKEDVKTLDDLFIKDLEEDWVEKLTLFMDKAARGRSGAFNAETVNGWIKLNISCRTYEGAPIFICIVDKVLTPDHRPNSAKDSIAFGKLITDNTFELIFRCDGAGRIVYFNRMFVESLVFPTLWSARKKNLQQILIDDFESIKDEFQSGVNAIKKQVWLKKEDGGVLRGLAKISSYKASSGELFYSWVILDLSRHTEYEHYLKSANNELKEVKFQLEQFLYSTSHDLRSPLTNILGLVNLIKTESQNDNIKEYVSKIEESANGLNSMITNIAYLTRVNYYASNCEKISLKKLLKHVIDEFHSLDNHFEIRFNVCVEDDALLFSDEEKIRIVLDQLIRNAIMFRDLNKEVLIVEIKVVSKNGRVQISILDNGIGIEEEHMKYVFNLFYKGTPKSPGSGLGLFIVKEAIDSLKGIISIGSQVGVGSWVTLEVPSHEKKHNAIIKSILKHDTQGAA